MLTMIAAVAAMPLTTTLEPPTAPPGIRAEWSFIGDCNPTVRVHNDTAAPVEVDWMRSTVALNGAAVALVPGSTSDMASRITIPPLVVPPSAYGQEMLFRKNQGTDDCLLTPGRITLTLAVGGGWLTQAVVVAVDAEGVARQEAFLQRAAELKAAEEERQRMLRLQAGYDACLAEKATAEKKMKTRRAVGWGLGGTIAGVGLVNIASGIVQAAERPNAAGVAVSGGAMMVVGGAATWGLLYVPTGKSGMECVPPTPLPVPVSAP